MNLNDVANVSLSTKVIMFRAIPVLCQVVVSIGLGVLNKHGTVAVRSPKIFHGTISQRNLRFILFTIFQLS
jgi:hypothetical protein